VPSSERARSQKADRAGDPQAPGRDPGIELRVGLGGPIYVALLGNDDAAMQRVIEDFKRKVRDSAALPTSKSR
jgi:hypothetical protein